MDLRKTWEKYREESTFNYSVLPESLKNRGECVEIEPKTLIVSRGAFPQEVFFILEGTAAGSGNMQTAMSTVIFSWTKVMEVSGFWNCLPEKTVMLLLS